MLYRQNDTDQNVIYDFANGSGLNYNTQGIRKVYDALYKSIGYDGLIEGNEIVAFHPNQIKLASNANPTEDVDIRYSEDITSVKFNEKEHTKKEREIFDDYLRSVDRNLLALVSNVYNGESPFVRHTIGKIGQQSLNLVADETGRDYSSFSFAISSDAIKHINKRHGEYGKANRSMRNPKDVARIPFVLQNADEVYTLREKDGSPYLTSAYQNSDQSNAGVLVFLKKIDSTYAVAVATPDSKWKKMWVMSAFLTNKKSAITQTVNADIAALTYTSETELASLVLSDESIQENGENVKPEADISDIRFSTDLAPVFYSRLEREIDAFKGDKIGAASIVPYLILAINGRL